MSERPERRWFVLLAVACGQLMVVVDITILNIALPALSRELGASMAGIQWAIISYALAMVGLVPTFGRLSDIFGRKRLYIAGLLGFSFGSALAAASGSIAWLIFARVVQAIGGAMITSNTLSILTDVFPPGRRGIAMGIQSILISGGAAVGPTLGGFLVTQLGWEWIFLVNVPIGVGAALLAGAVLPPLRPGEREPVDWLGAGALLLGQGSLLLAITKAPDWSWSSPRTLAALAVGLAALAAFIERERRVAHPIVRLSVFRIRAFSLGQLAGMCTLVALSSMAFLFPFYWQVLRGESAQLAGILMLPMPLALMVVAPLAGHASDRYGARGVTSFGLLLASIALFLLSRIGAETAVPDVLWRYGLLGLGLGMFLAPNNNAVMSSVPKNSRGVAAGLLALFRFTGQSLGIALGGTIFVHASHSHLALLDRSASAAASPVSEGAARAFIDGFHAVCLMALPFALVAALMSLVRGPRPEELPAEKWAGDKT